MKRTSAAANAGLILGLAIALYVGFRLPSLWSVNYYIPSIFDGFWRRSLLGTLLYPAGADAFSASVSSASRTSSSDAFAGTRLRARKLPSACATACGEAFISTL